MEVLQIEIMDQYTKRDYLKRQLDKATKQEEKEKIRNGIEEVEKTIHLLRLREKTERIHLDRTAGDAEEERVNNQNGQMAEMETSPISVTSDPIESESPANPREGESIKMTDIHMVMTFEVSDSQIGGIEAQIIDLASSPDPKPPDSSQRDISRATPQTHSEEVESDKGSPVKSEPTQALPSDVRSEEDPNVEEQRDSEDYYST